MTINNVEDMLRRDEGEVLSAYTDSLGYLTIGVGRLIDKRKGGGITKEESTYLLRNDIQRKTEELERKIPWTKDLDPPRKAVLVNMSFQMGVSGLIKFKNTLAMIQAGKYADAANSMMLSLWAKQTPSRAFRLSEQLRWGKWQ
jgi:lysozyme